jgi:hypothetical protein
MKKLVTAFALCAAISAMAVESENVVGYQTVTCAQGFTVFTPTFLTVGGTPYTFKDISGTMEWYDNLQFFDSYGDVNFTAYWQTVDTAPGGIAGWYDGDGNALANTVIPAGQGFFISLANAGSITVKGEVNTSNVTVTSVEGFKVMGNCMPAGVKYGDLVCTGIAWYDNLQFFDIYGDVNFTAYWQTVDTAPGGIAGWYDGDGNALANTVIPAGQGFFLSTASAGVTIQIPAPTI